MKSLNNDNKLWTRLSVEELEKREEYSSLATNAAVDICCWDLCCWQACCLQISL